MIVDLADLAAMEAFGERIAGQLRPGDVVALSGGLGAGKTTLARAIIAALGHRGEVPSPTFTIVETYDHLRIPLVHADFYRLDHPSEAAEIGLDDYREGAALLAEWPDHAGGFEHEATCLSIALETVGEGRQAIVKPGKAWQSRMP
ncbi:tRNA (adenosine(37)-N6)-threonylcarbamoyltransferase complex ATPase subunit type 1 TsaE [Qipengyuania sp. GH1]|uniref:tRNA (adenosine(37)-N6)-threonylcarbamoyltransferase complex ATPase subunit type 1 TsaE n=1 Tax=Qipengyuania aestuarii TaxID=2867241 RepID=UPI001C881A57|nr:tRNA (adenosine(37)-N6)-threonylcarbamoyltransferase complex ATPase subunit type 1 TsaE [Qipengyuania aestuarii]MBX7534526.1 tRNA (adenosine(37)-N6)-threonylcarbamoyltransferase complex ATPase subunit type 1 TsaE [Qipengyuania aestuarii]